MDWHGLLRTGLAVLRLTPEQFWQLTPAELALMLGAEDARLPMDRAGIERLLERFPDTAKGRHDG